MIDAVRTDCTIRSIKNILLSRDTADYNTWEPQRHAHTFRVSTISPETARSTFQIRPNGYHGRGRFTTIPTDAMGNKRIGMQQNKSTTTWSYTYMTTRRIAAQVSPETARSTFQMRPNGYHGRGRFITIPPDATIPLYGCFWTLSARALSGLGSGWVGYRPHKTTGNGP